MAIYVSSHISSELAFLKVNPLSFESIFVKLLLHENKHLIIGSIYGPPPVLPNFTNCIVSTITSFEHPSEMIILVHFNSNWLDLSSLNNKNLFRSINSTQLINEPTIFGSIQLL